MAHHRSSAQPLAWLYVGLIAYASLYPFSGWRLPGPQALDFLFDRQHFLTSFDLVANLLGYLPFGALAFGAGVRSGRRAWVAVAMATALGAGLSLSMELMQNFLPRRVPSNIDLALNTLGTIFGALLGLLVHRCGLVTRWQALRERWFIDRSAGGLALLVLWPLGLLFPTPVPLGLGQVLERARGALSDLLDGSLLAPWVEPWLIGEPRAEPVLPVAEVATVALGLLAPCLLAFAVSRRGWRRLVLVAGAVAFGLLATTLSTALNFGPDHALAWRTPNAMAGLLGGALVAVLLAAVPARAAAGLGLMVLTALVVLVSQAPEDPYFAQSLMAWEQGRFIRFHGAAQWVGWLWPYVAAAYLLGRTAARDEG
jgi:VanZ family protein